MVSAADTTGGLTSTEHGGDPANGGAGPRIAARRTHNVRQTQLNSLLLCCGDQVIQCVGLCLDGIVLRLHTLFRSRIFRQQLHAVGDLMLQRHHGSIHIGVLLLQHLTVGSQLIAGITKALNDAALIFHDLVNEVDAANEVGKTGGLKQHRPVGADTTLFLHTDLLVEQLRLLLLQLQIGGDALLRHTHLLLQQVDLRLQRGIALIQQRLFILGVGLILLYLLQLRFNVAHFLTLCLDLVLQIVPLLADRIGLSLFVVLAFRGKGRRRHTQQHQQRKHKRENGSDRVSFHK